MEHHTNQDLLRLPLGQAKSATPQLRLHTRRVDAGCNAAYLFRPNRPRTTAFSYDGSDGNAIANQDAPRCVLNRAKSIHTGRSTAGAAPQEHSGWLADRRSAAMLLLQEFKRHTLRQRARKKGVTPNLLHA